MRKIKLQMRVDELFRRFFIFGILLVGILYGIGVLYKILKINGLIVYVLSAFLCIRFIPIKKAKSENEEY